MKLLRMMLQDEAESPGRALVTVATAAGLVRGAFALAYRLFPVDRELPPWHRGR